MENLLTLGELNEKMKILSNWSLEETRIVKDFIFKDFKEALIFVNRVGEIAERQGHHPDISIMYCNVRLSLTTHESKGLTKKDFEVAEEIDRIEQSINQ